MAIIRNAILQDAKSITRIYNHAILHGTATFDTEEKTIENREQWLREHSEKYPVLVVEVDSEVVAFASLSRWSERIAYQHTAELSIYVWPDFQHRGIGKLLMSAIVQKGREAGLHCLISRITQGNEHSIYLHTLHGFEHVGVLREVGEKFGTLLDVTIMQLLLNIKKA